ncbi:DUF1971 domain-containing protein [Duganella violaceipulchra]|uniref:DUF1971 domain-containing protein n=1 Tax=Duganella violaceipulchra TaxID=2849652 RepID=A0AA41L4L8_9BURK|nr:DUF1971 domain-containing protein [Duganella violaceicalia]MBV6325453.1 DUF1971 domain-containing protein [Duganella violaceicalia]MCP2012646.1 tellurite resistance-related uncharacterized protein [Duganella violaceicalia]
MRSLPEGVAHYKSSPVFTEETVPAALQRSHTTAEGTWGRITILEGSLLYRITDERVPAEEILLTPEKFGVVEPRIEHEVSIVGPVRFQVDFHR